MEATGRKWRQEVYYLSRKGQLILTGQKISPHHYRFAFRTSRSNTYKRWPARRRSYLTFLVTARSNIYPQEMGLGKTLSVLALVAWHLDNLQISTGDSEIRPTLIVTPKSSTQLSQAPVPKRTLLRPLL